MELDNAKKNSSPSAKLFIIGFGFGIATFAVVAFMFFWFAVFRRVNVLNIPLSFDSDVAAATIIVPLIVAIPWLPLSIISGFLTKKTGLRKALQFILPIIVVFCIVLGFIF